MEEKITSYTRVFANFAIFSTTGKEVACGQPHLEKRLKMD
jgi:hypothetical protein